MKNKSILLKTLIIMLVLSALVRFGNIYILAFGDEPNVYALSHTGGLICNLMIDGTDFGVTIDETSILQFGDDYEISNWNRGAWELLGLFGIHNMNDGANMISFYNTGYNGSINIEEDESISFYCKQNCENDYAHFWVIDGQIVVSNKVYQAAIDEHADVMDEVIYKAEDALRTYQETMNRLVLVGITFESILLVIHVVLIIRLSMLHEKVEKQIAFEEPNSVSFKIRNLNWGLVMWLFFSFMFELLLLILFVEGDYLSFVVFGVLFWVPLYIITAIAIFVIYFILRQKYKKKEIDNPKLVR